MKRRVRWLVAMVAAMAAGLGLTVSGGPAARAADPGGARVTPRATTRAAPPAARSTDLIAHDLGGSELASPGVAVHYPAAGAVALPQVPASAYVIADADTGQVLAAKDAHGLFPPASTLKVLTAVALIPLLNPNALVLATRQAAQTAEYDVGLVAGRRYRVSDLFNALLLISANDAAVALTQATGSLGRGMALINAEAHRLQAYDVVARVPNGLPADGQVVSAYDEALIARRALAMPAFMRYDSTLTARFPVTSQTLVPLVNQNRLLTQYPGGIGGKIGWTEAAGATYIGMARRHGVTLIVTVLHCTSLQEITAGEKLLDWGFAMDGRVRPVGELVRPLPALPARRVTPAASTARPGPTSTPALPAVSLAAGAGVIIVIVLSVGWLGRRRRHADPGRRAAGAGRPDGL